MILLKKLNKQRILNDQIITKYTGLQAIYFNKILLNIIKIGRLNFTNKKILDFGCGNKQLSKLLNKKILNYDLNPNYSDFISIDNLKFDIVVINHVLMYLSIKEIKNLFFKIYSINKNARLIVGVGKQNFLSIFLKILTLKFNAHKGTKSTYKQQIEFLKRNMIFIEKKRNIFFMTDIFYLKFNNVKLSLGGQQENSS
jgi:2-polyprenyl-3-methyl-5-hydroxy-6-metoxy-1,4-benzoquinol methylase